MVQGGIGFSRSIFRFIESHPLADVYVAAIVTYGQIQDHPVYRSRRCCQQKDLAMIPSITSPPACSADVDLIEELRLRRWARENYVPPPQRDPNWHPIILEEMRRKDDEVNEPILVS